MKTRIIIAAIVLVAISLAFAFRDKLFSQLFRPTDTEIEQGELVKEDSGEIRASEIFRKNLNIPWEIEFLPDGDFLITERAGKLYRLGKSQQVIEISGVTHRGEGGLLGLAVHPNFSKNGWIYLYLTSEDSQGVRNRVERYKLEGLGLKDRTIIVDNIPGASYHDGGRIAFGPDGYLYITTGDAGRENTAQDTKSLAGKILRVDENGGIPKDNPFGNAVYSYGHRNVQGIAWDSRGQFWATEHGRSGIKSGFDEINKIIKGGNYGWPMDQENEGSPGTIKASVTSGPDDTWAPSGAMYLKGRLIFAGLRGETLYVLDISSGEAGAIKGYLREEYGRLRTAKLGPDGMIYILTNNRDGRGTPVADDDRIIKIDPKTLGI
jgi:glucose/arabinose dehydrogenase